MEYPQTVGQWPKCSIHVMGLPEGEREAEEIFEVIMVENFLKLMMDSFFCNDFDN